MKSIKQFEYYGNSISFDLADKNIMVNATEMAKPFNKIPNNWLQLPSSKRYLDALRDSRKSTIAHSLIITQKGGNALGGGSTWFHREVAIEYARWLSPHFGIWCNDRILELLEFGVTFINQEVRDNFLSMTEVAREIKAKHSPELGRTFFFKMLRKQKILNKNNKPYPKYVDSGYFKYLPLETNKYVDKLYLTESGFKWLVETLFNDSSTSTSNTAIVGDLNSLKEQIAANDMKMEALYGMLRAIGSMFYGHYKGDPNKKGICASLESALLHAEEVFMNIKKDCNSEKMIELL